MLTPCRQAELPSCLPLHQLTTVRHSLSEGPVPISFLQALSRHMATAAPLEGRPGTAWLHSFCSTLPGTPATVLLRTRDPGLTWHPALLTLQEMAPLPQDTGTGKWARARTGMHTHSSQVRLRWKNSWLSIEISCCSSPVSPAGPRLPCQVQETHLLVQREGVTSLQHHLDTNRNL